MIQVSVMSLIEQGSGYANLAGAAKDVTCLFQSIASMTPTETSPFPVVLYYPSLRVSMFLSILLPLLLGGPFFRAYASPLREQKLLATHHKPMDSDFNIQFESGEHDMIGDALKLHYPDRVVKGADFAYNVSRKHGKTKPLSFGQLVAFGDYYGAWQLQPDLVPPEDLAQISDHWIANQTSATTFFDRVADLVRENYKCAVCHRGYLPDLSDRLIEEKASAQKYRTQGGDAAQWYDENIDEYEVAYDIETGNALLVIAWQNWDHFGQDAIYAYSAGHTLALQYAHRAHKSGNVTLLTEAYFIEGFAQHFLSDLFSTGHHRDPRRILHGGPFDQKQETCGSIGLLSTSSPSVSTKSNFLPHTTTASASTTTDDTTPLPSIGARDLLSGKLHNEDCANGLFVQNVLGEQWPAYGDNQLLSDKSILNLKQAIRAGQAGVDEIFATFLNDTVPSVANFTALQIVPLLAEKALTSNYQPLFAYDNKTSNLIFKRAHNDQRNSSAVVSLDPEKATSDDWDTWDSEISASGSQKNMYPYTQPGLATDTKLLQLRWLENTLILTQFGNITVGNITTWNAKQQSSLSLGDIKSAEATWSWRSVKSLPITADMYHLTATSVETSDTFTVHRFAIGVPKFNISQAYVVAGTYSNNTYPDDTGCGNSGSGVSLVDSFLPGDTIGYVTTLNGNSNLAKDSLSAATLNLSPVFPSNTPSKTTTTARIANAYALTLVRLDPDLTQSIALIACAVPQTNEPIWYLAYWTSDGAATITRTNEESLPSHWLIGTHLLSMSSTSSSASRALRISHDINSTYLAIDTLQVSLGTPIKVSSRTIWSPPEDSPPNLPFNRADWVATGPPSSTKLVGYVHFLDEAAGGLLAILAFNYSAAEEKFAFHSLSYIGNSTDLDPPKKLVTAPFLRPVSVSEVAAKGDASDGWPSLMEAFDNYGVLGARLVTPYLDQDEGVWKYELKGQTPSLAGQMSTGLGWNVFGENGVFGEGVGYIWES